MRVDRTQTRGSRPQTTKPLRRPSVELLECRHLLTSFGFVPTLQFEAGTDSHVFLGDVDGDHRNDVIQAFPMQGDIRWMRNLDEQLEVETQFGVAETLQSVPGGFSAITVRDINDDGLIDIVFAANRDSRIHILESMEGADGFRETTIEDVPTVKPEQIIFEDNSRFVALGEGGLNLFLQEADGFVLADTFMDNIHAATIGKLNRASEFDVVFNRKGEYRSLSLMSVVDGSFQSPNPIGNNASRWAIGDFDGNELDELFVLDNKKAMTIWQQSDDGLVAMVSRGSPEPLQHIDVVDLDDDGQDEIVGISHERFISWNHELKIESAVDLQLPVSRQYLNQFETEFGEIDGDRFSDMLLQFNREFVSWYPNIANPSTVVRPIVSNGNLIDAVDFDGDGQSDLLVRQDTMVNLHMSTGGVSSISLSGHVDQLLAADFDGDQTLDVVFVQHDQLVGSRFDRANRQFETPNVLFQASAGIGRITVGDLNQDERPDIALNSLTTVSILLRTADGTYAVETIRNRWVLSLDVADYDGDGANELVLLELARRGALVTTWQVDAGRFQMETSKQVASADRLWSIDADGDNKDEILFHTLDRNYALLSFVSNDGFREQPLSFNNSVVTRVDDSDGDGREEIFGGNEVGYYRFEFDDVEDRFVETAFIGIPFNRYFLHVVADINHDGTTESVFTHEGQVVYADPTPEIHRAYLQGVPIWSLDAFVNATVTGDFDGDRKDDWAVVTGAGIYVSYAGSFHVLDDLLDWKPFPTGFNYPQTVAIDVTGDDRDEIILFDRRWTVIIDLENNHISVSETEWDAATLQIIDFDQDGLDDIAWWDPSVKSIVVARNGGDGEFQDRQSILSLPDVVLNRFSISDVNSDGLDDIVVAGKGVSVYQRLHSGEFEQTASVLADIQIADVDARDMNGDGLAEIAVSNSVFTGLLAQTEPGQFTLSTRLNDRRSGRSELAIIDVDADGLLDIVDYSEWYQLLAVSDSVFQFEKRPHAEGFELDVLLDVDGDRRFEALDVDRGVLAKIGRIEFSAAEIIPLNTIEEAAWIDSDGDGELEIVARDATSVWLFEPYRGQWFPTKIVERRAEDMLVADVDGDGADELFLNGASMFRLRRSEAGWIGHSVYGDLTLDGVIAFDIDHDGDLDFVESAFNTLSVRENQGADLFADNSTVRQIARFRSDRFLVEDFNRDGRTDLIAGGFGDIRFHDGIFENPQREPVLLRARNGSRNPVPFTIVDVDRNGWTDVVIGLPDELQWLPNSSEGFASEWQHLTTTSIETPTDLTARDVDGDGDIDFVVEAPDRSVILMGGIGQDTTTVDLPIVKLVPSGDGRVVGQDRNGSWVLFEFQRDQITHQTLYSGMPVFDLDDDENVGESDLNILHGAIVRNDQSDRFDMTRDGTVSLVDGLVYVEQVLGRTVGDVDGNGVFDSSDLVRVFQNNKYEAQIDAVWQEGDWNFDGRFDSADLVIAFQRSHYFA